MLQVTNGRTTLMVSTGAYNNFYKHRGFHPGTHEDDTEELEGAEMQPLPGSSEGGEKTMEPAHENEGEGETDGEDDTGDEHDGEEVADLSEIPLGEMDFEQLCAYADQLGLNRDGIETKKPLRQLIREHLKG